MKSNEHERGDNDHREEARAPGQDTGRKEVKRGKEGARTSRRAMVVLVVPVTLILLHLSAGAVLALPVLTGECWAASDGGGGGGVAIG